MIAMAQENVSFAMATDINIDKMNASK
jgi:hypothetical protein